MHVVTPHEEDVLRDLEQVDFRWRFRFGFNWSPKPRQYVSRTREEGMAKCPLHVRTYSGVPTPSLSPFLERSTSFRFQRPLTTISTSLAV